jgi:Ser/Thr protein kinase RdoA (MazF antagonist)
MTAPAAILDRYFLSQDAPAARLLGGAGGFSGSLLWRVRSSVRGADKDFCLRRWPREHPSRERLALIHDCLTHVAARGIAFVPVPCRTLRGETFFEHEGHLWELIPWMPGAADYRMRSSRARLSAALQALAAFHRAAEGFRRAGGIQRAPAPTFSDRLTMVQRLLGGDFQRLADAAGADRSLPFQEPAREILALSQARLPGLEPKLATAARQPLPLTPAIRDIHHQHVLFTGDEVTGIIDFGAMRIDTQLADIARLVGSLAGDDDPDWQIALQAYQAVRPLSDEDRHLIRVLDESTVVLSGLSWLRWLYLEQRDMGPEGPIAQRLGEIVQRLRAQARLRPAAAEHLLEENAGLDGPEEEDDLQVGDIDSQGKIDL